MEKIYERIEDLITKVVILVISVPFIGAGALAYIAANGAVCGWRLLFEYMNNGDEK